MLNHGTGMAFCLKSVSNKLSTFATVVVRRKHVTLPERQLPRHLVKSPFLQEFLLTNHGVGPTTPALQQSVLGAPLEECFRDRLEVPKLPNTTSKVNLGNIVQSSNQSEEWSTTANKLSIGSQPCQWSYDQYQSHTLRMWGIPSKGTQDDITLTDLTGLQTNSKKAVPWNEDNSFLFSDLEKQMILLSKSDDPARGLQMKKEFITGDPSQPPNEEQLEKVRSTLAHDLPMFFVRPLNYQIYHPAIVLENNIQGKRTAGIYDYVKQAALLRIIGHIRFMYVKYEVMKITAHPEDGTVKVRWRIRIMRVSKLLKFWTIKIWEWSTVLDKLETWFDGFSTYYVMGDGLVHKHVADKMMPDQEQIVKKLNQKTPTDTPAETLFISRPDTSFYILHKSGRNPHDVAMPPTNLE